MRLSWPRLVVMVSFLVVVAPVLLGVADRGGALKPSRAARLDGAMTSPQKQLASPHARKSTARKKAASKSPRAHSSAGKPPSTIHTTPIPWLDLTTLELAFDVYNQGRATSGHAQVRAFLSDHGTMAAHALRCPRNDEIEISLDSGPECDGENCVGQLAPGDLAHYSGSISVQEGGLGRHELASIPGNQAAENPDGTFTLTATETTFSSVAFRFGRYLWVDVDSALDEDGEKVDESGQQIAPLLENDRKGQLVSDTAPTFGDLTHLSATFRSIEGGAGEGTPRLDVYLAGHGKLGIRLGDPPFSSDDSTLSGFSWVNVIGSYDGRYDTSGVTGVAPELNDADTDYDTALEAAGDFEIDRIEFVAYGSATFPDREYLLEHINVSTGSGAEPVVTEIQGGLAFPVGIAANDDFLFWAERGDSPYLPGSGQPLGNIWMSGLDGSSPHIIASGQVAPTWIAADDDAVYWTNQGTGPDGAVMKHDLADPPNVVTEVVPVEPNAGAIIVVAGQPYWLGNGVRGMDGGNPVTLNPYGGIHLDSDGESIVWTDYEGEETSRVLKIPLAGGTETELATLQQNTWEIQTHGGFVYWSNGETEVNPVTINRVPIGGGAIKTLVTKPNNVIFGSDDTRVVYLDNHLDGVPVSGGTPVKIASPGGCGQDFVVRGNDIYFTNFCGASIGSITWVHWD